MIAKLIGIYVLYWIEQGYYYFGQSNNLNGRKSQHLRALKNGVHDNPILQKVYNKYGLPQFECAEYEEQELNRLEQLLLDSFIGKNGCCNINPSATNERGWERSDECRAKLRAYRLGTKLTAEHKASISKTLYRNYEMGVMKPTTKCGKDNPFYGKTHSEETKNKIRKGNRHGAINGRARPVINLETGILYDTATEAAIAHCMKPLYLMRYLNGERRNKTSLVYVSDVLRKN